MTEQPEEDKLIAALQQVSTSIEGFACYVIASSNGKIIAEGGDRAKLRWPSLMQMLFGGSEEISCLFDFLEGKVIPQHYGQGDIHCVLLKPTKDIVVGIFYERERDAAKMYYEGLRVAADLDARMAK